MLIMGNKIKRLDSIQSVLETTPGVPETGNLDLKEECSNSEWRKERIMLSRGTYTRGESWEEYEKNEKKRVGRDRKSILNKLEQSAKLGISDEEAEKNATTFSLQRVERIYDEDDVCIKEISRPITPNALSK